MVAGGAEGIFQRPHFARQITSIDVLQTRFLPDLGGVDLSPLVLILLLQALRILLGEVYVGMLTGFG